MHILTFINDCNKAIQAFSSSLIQIRKEASSIESIIRDISETALADTSIFDGRVYHIGTLYEKMEGFRSQKISVLLEKYKSIAAVLLKVESLVSGTGTYRSPSLQYYEYWEKRIYNAIVVMIVRGLATMKSFFQVGNSQ